MGSHKVFFSALLRKTVLAATTLAVGLVAPISGRADGDLNGGGYFLNCGTGGLGTITCPTAPSVAGESAGTAPTTVVQAANVEEGIIYASELFGAGTATDILPDGSSGVVGAAAVYEIDGDIEEETKVSFSLDNGVSFTAGTLALVVERSGGTVSSITVTSEITSGSTVRFSIADADPDGTVDGSSVLLADGDRLILFYQITGVGGLSTSGTQVTMNATLRMAKDKTGLQKTNPDRNVVIAQSTQAVTFELVKNTLGVAYISMSADGKEFTGTSVPEGVYISDSEVAIGELKINRTSSDIMQKDGITQFALDETVVATLTIESCQCAASKEGTGKIYLEALSLSGEVDDSGEIATWQLQGDTHLDKILNAGSTRIIVAVDGETEINVPENDPQASIEVVFSGGTTGDPNQPKALRKVVPDGAVCHLFNIPNTVADGANDILNIRITNDSKTVGELKFTLYDETGAQIFVSQPAEGKTIKAGQTIHLGAEDLKDMAGGVTWTGRGYLTVRSNLPRMEAFNLLRGVVPTDYAFPLTNMSLGAHGDSCDPVGTYP